MSADVTLVAFRKFIKSVLHIWFSRTVRSFTVGLFSNTQVMQNTVRQDIKLSSLFSILHSPWETS